jgi:K+-sensing histidine kinase KdpD
MDAGEMFVPNERRRERVMAPIDWEMWGHELRTPLTVLMGAASLIGDAELSGPETRDLALSIEKNAQELHRLLENWLTVCRLDAGNLRWLKQAIDLRMLFQMLDERVGEESRCRGVAWDLRLQPGPLLVRADGESVELILSQVLEAFLKQESTLTAITLDVRRENGGVAVTMFCQVGDDAAVCERMLNGDLAGIGLVLFRGLIERGNAGRTYPIEAKDGWIRTGFWLPEAFDA